MFSVYVTLAFELLSYDYVRSQLKDITMQSGMYMFLF